MYWIKIGAVTLWTILKLTDYLKFIVLITERIIRCTNKISTFFFIKNWAFIVKEWNVMFYSKYCSSYCSSCMWHESWSNKASNSASSYTFDLILHILPSMSNIPFLNFWNHSRQFLSLKAASPYVSTSNRYR